MYKIFQENKALIFPKIEDNSLKLDATLQKDSVRSGLFAPCLDYVRLAYEAIRDNLSGKRKRNLK